MKKIIRTQHAPDPVGPYNQAVVHNYTLYVSGQIAINPVTKNLVLEDIESETRQVMENLKAILTEAGLTFEEVLKVTIFVSDMGNYEKINGVYGKYFEDKTAPARELVQVVRLPKDVNIEISLIAAFA